LNERAKEEDENEQKMTISKAGDELGETINNKYYYVN
jgi:hypothetical protein